MKKVIVGNHAVSWGVKLARTEVISAYPITPQTQVVEQLLVSTGCKKGCSSVARSKIKPNPNNIRLSQVDLVGLWGLSWASFTA